MADKIFKNNPGLAVVMEDKLCHSDIEDGPNGKAPVGKVAPWRSVHLTTVLHSLDKMVQAQATHPKTIMSNQNMYNRSARYHSKVIGGAVGVAHDWPIDCYDLTFWNGLSKFEQETISRVPAVNIHEIADQLSKNCAKGPPTGPSRPPDQGSTSHGKRRHQRPEAEGTLLDDESQRIEAKLSVSGSMNVDRD